MIEYVKETPKNTNLGMLGVYGCEPSEDADTVTLTRASEGNEQIEYYTECGGETKYFEDTLVIPKGTILYFSTVGGLITMINGTPIEPGECVSYIFTTDSTIFQNWEE